jgi:hypothetical protein
MKKILTLIVLIAAITTQAFAFGNAGLQLRNSNHLPLTVYINGHMVAQSTPNILIQNIPAGQHWIQIDQPGRSIGMGGATFQTIFSGNLTLPAQSMTSAIVYLNQLVIESQYAMHQQPLNLMQPGHGHVAIQPNYGFGNQHYYMPINHNYGHFNQGHFGGGFHQPNHVPVMSHEQFARLKQSIRNQSFSSGQRQIVDQALATNYLTSQQVFELVNMFTFNSDKVSVAKKAYHRTIDPENYFVVYDALDYNSSVNEVASYIAGM